MSKLILNEITNVSQVSVINDNFDKIEDYIQDRVLSRDNPSGEPNEMQDTLDMNGNRIINLAAPSSPSEAARLQDVMDSVAGAKTAALTEFTPAAGVAATNVQGAIEEVANDLSGHIADVSEAHVSEGISFTQVGGGAVVRDVRAKLSERPSVKDFGAVGDGVVNDTAAFTAAAAEYEYIEVPESMNCKVDAGILGSKFYGMGKVFEPGFTWQVNKSPQTSALLKNYKSRTFGTYEQAAGMAVSINSANGQEKENCQVLGTSTLGLSTVYTDRDHVGQYVQAYSYAPDVLDNTTTYTSTTLTNSAVGALYASGGILPGMIIDTLHATPLTGRVQSVAGNVITVDAWYTRTTGVIATPANGVGVVINPNTKIWGQNTNVFLSGNAGNRQAQKGTGHEIGLACDATTTGVNVWGVDVITLGGKPEMHYVSRGSRTYGYMAQTGADYGYRSVGNGRGFSSSGDTLPFEMVGTGSWSVTPDGGDTSNGVKRIGVAPTQCTNAGYTNVGPLPAAYGGMFWVSGFNTAGGLEACFLLMVRSGLVVTVSSSDATGLAIAFQASGRQLQIRCNNPGTFQFVAHGFVA